MRACLVSRSSPTPRGDGPARYAWEAATALLAAGHEVHILTGEPAPADDHPEGAILHHVDLSSGPAAIPRAYPTPKLRHAMAVYSALLRLHEAHRFDLVEFPLADGEGYFAIRGKRMLGQFAGATLAVRLATPAADRRRENGTAHFDGEAAFTDHMELASMREADLLASPSRALLDLVRERIETDAAWPTPASAVIPPPLSTSPLSTLPPHESSPSSTVLFPFPLEQRCGVRVFVDAARRLLTAAPSLRFRLAGADTDTAPVGRSMLAELKARFGPLPEDRVALDLGDRSPDEAAIAAAGAVCFPAPEREPPYLLLDAMARGVPVVLADAPGLRETLADSPGVRLATPDDPGDLGRAILAAVADGRGRRDLSAFDPRAFADRLLAAVSSAAADVPAPQHPATAPPADSAPELSVIVPVYNLGRYLPQTLASIDAQTFRGFELIIVDDGSTDPETLSLLDRLAAEGRRIIRKPNGGLGSARNAGIAAASGRWIASIDADDLIDPAYLERTAAVLRSNPSLTYACALVRSFESDPETITAGWVPLGMAGFDRDLLLCFNVGGIAGSVFDRRAVLDAGGYDESLPGYQDWDLWCRLAQRSARGAVIPEFLFYYRVRADSMYHGGSLARHPQLKSYLLAHHASGGLLSSRTLRLQFSEAAAADTALRALHEQLDSLNQTLREVQEAQGDLARRTAEAESNAAAAWANADELERLLQKTAAELAAAEARIQASAAELDAHLRDAAAQAAELGARTDEVQRRLEHESAERARLETRLDQATTQTLLTGEQLTRAQADLARAQRELAELRQQIATHDCGVHTRQVLAENVRYRVADRVNNAIRGTGVHSAAKALARRTITNGEHNKDNGA